MQVGPTSTKPRSEDGVSPILEGLGCGDAHFLCEPSRDKEVSADEAHNLEMTMTSLNKIAMAPSQTRKYKVRLSSINKKKAVNLGV